MSCLFLLRQSSTSGYFELYFTCIAVNSQSSGATSALINCTALSHLSHFWSLLAGRYHYRSQSHQFQAYLLTCSFLMKVHFHLVRLHRSLILVSLPAGFAALLFSIWLDRSVSFWFYLTSPLRPLSWSPMLDIRSAHLIYFSLWTVPDRLSYYVILRLGHRCLSLSSSCSCTNSSHFGGLLVLLWHAHLYISCLVVVEGRFASPASFLYYLGLHPSLNLHWLRFASNPGGVLL